jgi:hypothetical protein
LDSELTTLVLDQSSCSISSLANAIAGNLGPISTVGRYQLRAYA